MIGPCGMAHAVQILACGTIPMDYNGCCLNSDQPIGTGYCGTCGIGNGFWGVECHPKGFSGSLFGFRFCSCLSGIADIWDSEGESPSEVLVSSDHARWVRFMVKKGLSGDLTEFLGGFEDQEFEFSKILGLFALGFEGFKKRGCLRFEIGHEGSLIPTQSADAPSASLASPQGPC